MYLSQPRDLISSMSAGCSRGSTVFVHDDNPAPSASPPTAFNADNLSALRSSLTSDEDRLESYDSAATSTPPSPARSDDASLRHALSSSDARTASRWFRAQHFQRVWETLDPGNIEMRPPHPYTELIKLCILKRREGKLTLSQLYRDLEDKFPFFATSHKGKGWKASNTLRHNLSTQPYFIKLNREHGQLGKGHYWAYCPDLEKPASLAQSSIVQMSSLWPPSTSSASAFTREDLAREWTDHQRSPRSYDWDVKLPPFEGYIRSQQDEGRRSYPSPPFKSPVVESQRTQPYPMRRLSNPTRHAPSHSSYEMHRPATVETTRSRSATISTIPRQRPAGDSWVTPSPERERRKSSTFWATPKAESVIAPPFSSFSSDSQCGKSSGEDDELISRLPLLSNLLPPYSAPARKSLGDYYLSNPISRR